MAHPLNPILAERMHLIADLPPLGSGPPDPAAMAAFDAFGAPIEGYSPPEVEITSSSVAGPHGDIPIRIHRGADVEARFGLVWAHGGAFVMGDLDTPESDIVARELAHRAGIVVVTVDYRLCHGGVHFPVPHDDVDAVLVWASETSGLLADHGRWSIGGGSAGGNLAAGVAQRRRDEGVAIPDTAILAYPVLHDPVPRPDDDEAIYLDTLPGPLRFPPEGTAFINANYLGGQPSDVPYAFPGEGDVAGVARTYIAVCEYDDLAKSGRRFAEQLEAAGVDVTLDIVPGVPHGHLNIQGLPEALETIDKIVAFITQAEDE